MLYMELKLRKVELLINMELVSLRPDDQKGGKRVANKSIGVYVDADKLKILKKILVDWTGK